ncbi:MAG TPA: hypothetical protein VEG34_10790 [Thermoanaerobaculia bacterium]|nr:hypothetical protein [Thermoanaerobaculia bacterium]
MSRLSGQVGVPPETGCVGCVRQQRRPKREPRYSLKKEKQPAGEGGRGDWAIDEMCGATCCVTMQGLRLRWLLMSLPVWGLAWSCYRWIRSRRASAPVAWDLG